MAQFNLLIKNVPESVIEGRITRKGKIEHVFHTFGGIHMFFIQVQFRLTSGKEYYDAVAQVIPEAEGERDSQTRWAYTEQAHSMSLHQCTKGPSYAPVRHTLRRRMLPILPLQPPPQAENLDGLFPIFRLRRSTPLEAEDPRALG